MKSRKTKYKIKYIYIYKIELHWGRFNMLNVVLYNKSSYDIKAIILLLFSEHYKAGRKTWF